MKVTRPVRTTTGDGELERLLKKRNNTSTRENHRVVHLVVRDDAIADAHVLLLGSETEPKHSLSV